MKPLNTAANDQSEIKERDIHRTKCLLNAAIPASLNGKPPQEIKAVKSIVFEILDSEDPVYESSKGALIEGDLFDAAQILEFKAHRMPDRAAELFTKAAVLFAPVMTVKSVMAFENAQSSNADLEPYRSILNRLYKRMGDVVAAQQHKEQTLSNSIEPEPVELETPLNTAVLIPFPK